ncbi:MAG: type II toxin-antitoxin system RelE/ParE family toxin [Gammaproteobacteria bacterium]
MNRARFFAAARQEFLAEIAYYNEAQPGLGRRFTLALEEATDRALVFPKAGSPAASCTHRVIVKGFPFSIFYRWTATVSLSLPLRIMRGNLDTGRREQKPANTLGNL